MPGPRLVLTLVGVLLAVWLPSAASAQPAPPTRVTVHDSRTSAPVVDIAQVRLDASWYWDSEQSLRVTVPHGFRAGHRLTVWFDVDGDSTPVGHFDLALRAPKHPGGTVLQKSQEFRTGGGWTHGGALVRCTGSEDSQPAWDQVRVGQRTVSLALDLWWCLKVPSPAGTAPGAWRVAVALTKGKETDQAPNHRGWSPAVAGWGPCDPSGGQC